MFVLRPFSVMMRAVLATHSMLGDYTGLLHSGGGPDCRGAKAAEDVPETAE